MMIKKYLSSINLGQIPSMLDTWTSIKQEKSRQVVEGLKEVYTDRVKAKMANRLPLPALRITEALLLIREEMLADFKRQAYDDSDLEPIEEFLSSIESELQRLNSKDARVLTAEGLRKEYEPFHKKLFSSYYPGSDHF